MWVRVSFWNLCILSVKIVCTLCPNPEGWGGDGGVSNGGDHKSWLGDSIHTTLLMLSMSIVWHKEDKGPPNWRLAITVTAPTPTPAGENQEGERLCAQVQYEWFLMVWLPAREWAVIPGQLLTGQASIPAFCRMDPGSICAARLSRLMKWKPCAWSAGKTRVQYLSCLMTTWAKALLTFLQAISTFHGCWAPGHCIYCSKSDPMSQVVGVCFWHHARCAVPKASTYHLYKWCWSSTISPMKYWSLWANCWSGIA